MHRVGRIELGPEITAIAGEHRAGRRRDQRAIPFADPIRSKEIRPAGPVLPEPPGSIVENGRQLGVHFVQIARRMLVEDDDIGVQALQAPVLLRLQHLPHESPVILSGDTDEQHRQIAGNAVRPETGLSEYVRANRLGARAERAVGEEDL